MKIVGLLALLSVFASSESHLRSSSNDLTEESSCNGLSEQKCNQSTDDKTGESCQWCVAGAIPSECMTQEQAAQLPEGVFDCSTPGSASYSFHEGITHTLRVNKGESTLCDGSSSSISGYMDVKGSQYDSKGENKHLFFWMFEKRGPTENQESTPFIVWLTGGPGCSSTLALLTENGPCHVNDDGESTSLNPNSWTETAHVLWLDQPAGVGFSYGEQNDSNEEMISEDAYYFLQAFFKNYPQYAKSPLYVVGESYGGHYAPAISHRIWLGNKDLKKDMLHLNLSGLGIGNGLTDPEEQYKYYPEMGFNNSHSIQVFSEAQYEAMQAAVPRCTTLIHKCNSGGSTMDNFFCQSAFVACNLALTSPYQTTGLNPYDIRKPCGSHPLCYDFSMVEKFLNLKSTKQALNVDEAHSHKWSSCNMGINMKFHVDWMKDFSHYVKDLIEDGIPALIYAGDVDFICNYLGNQAWTYKLEWSGQEAFQADTPHEWEGAGLVRSAQGLTFLQVYDAGHMVPSDKPEVALKMIRTFVSPEKKF